ncbi:hypothetical protein CCP3SC5AM1_1100009 [Gammaproteobacteria bacterium]
MDQRIRGTYAERSTATNKNALYDSYIRAIRWASDRIGDSGVIGFVTNAGFLDGNAAAGLRLCLVDEFSSIYIFHLRGNGRTSGERCKKEGHPLFAAHGGKGGSLAPISINFFIKKESAKNNCQIYFHDIGDYLTRKEKLERMSTLGNIAGVDWRAITPDQHGDWLSQRDDGFGEFIVVGDKKEKGSLVIFENYSNGVKTNADAWMYNASKISLKKNMMLFTSIYNSEVTRYASSDKIKSFEDFVTLNSSEIKWHSGIIPKAKSGKLGYFEPKSIVPSLYRPFEKQNLYFDRMFIQRMAQMPHIFPTATAENRLICVSGIGARSGFSALIVDALPNLHTLDTGQCFPLYLYDEIETDTSDLFSALKKERRDAITDEGLAHFQIAYPSEKISKEDLFYYVYGLLHSPNYREKYADNLSKELPRIPCVPNQFGAFSQAGRKLAELHINYETVAMYPAIITGDDGKNYRVEKMRYGKDKDKTTIQYNAQITITDIPLEAYEYVVNGKPAIDWVMERQCVKTDKDSGIVNDANDWAVETMGNPRYPLELLLRVVTVSIETMKIVKALPIF